MYMYIIILHFIEEKHEDEPQIYYTFKSAILIFLLFVVILTLCFGLIADYTFLFIIFLFFFMFAFCFMDLYASYMCRGELHLACSLVRQIIVIFKYY